MNDCFIDCVTCLGVSFLVVLGIPLFIPLFIVSHFIAFIIGLVLSPIFMIKGDRLLVNISPRLPWYFVVFFSGWSSVFKCTDCIWNCLGCHILCCKNTFEVTPNEDVIISAEPNEHQRSVNTVTRQVPPPIVIQQPITTQSTMDLEEMNFQMAVLQSQFHEINRHVLSMNQDQNQLLETIPSIFPESDILACKICFMDMRAESHYPMVFDPCGHTCCKNCASQITECHMCRSNIVRKNRVYFY